MKNPHTMPQKSGSQKIHVNLSKMYLQGSALIGAAYNAIDDSLREDGERSGGPMSLQGLEAWEPGRLVADSTNKNSPT